MATFVHIQGHGEPATINLDHVIRLVEKTEDGTPRIYLTGRSEPYLLEDDDLVAVKAAIAGHQHGP